MAGTHPPCIREALAHAGRGDVVTGKSGVCEECFFESGCGGRDTLIIRSEHDSRLFGLLAVSLASGAASDDDEKELLKEAASDIALALHGIEIADAHRAAEDALRQSEENYRTIFDAANDAIFVHDIKNGNIIDANRKMCEMCGCMPDEARLLSVGDFSAGKPPYAQEDAMQWIRKASKGPQLFEWLAKDVSGRLLWTEVNLKRVVIKGEDRSRLDLIFSVNDTGIGIPKDQRAHIFEAFRQQEEATLKYGGTGLGLAITKRLVGLMNGEVSVGGEVGKGSTFQIKLRSVAVALVVESTGVKSAHSLESVTFEKSSVLVVDDVMTNRALVKGYLGPCGIKVMEAANGREAVDITRQHQPDLVLMDMKMPEMDGYEATRIIKGDDDLKIPPSSA